MMKVEIKEIREQGDDVFLLVRCAQPEQKRTPWSYSRKELEENEKLFQENSVEHRHEMEIYNKRISQIHLGEAKLYQESEE